MSKLLIRDLKGEERVHDLLEAITTIGRGRRNTIRADVPQASRQHCRIEKTPSGFRVVDNRSRNGTEVNGQKVDAHDLRPGDVISIGDFAMTFDPKPREGGGARLAASPTAAEVEEHAPYPPGAKVGRYVVHSLLGQSGLGYSYLAEQPFLGRKVVLKTLAVADESLAATMCSEARKLTSLNHPNIPGLHDADRHDGLPFVAWEYVPGWDLQQLVSTRGRPPMVVALRIVVAIASAAHHAHERCIVHNNINPRHVLLGANGEPMLTGFWLSTPSTSSLSAADKAAPGELAYRSPEKAQWLQPSPISDIWGLGATLYFLLTGRPPFAGGSRWHVQTQVLSPGPVDLAPLAENAPEYVVSIVEKCLRKKPDERYRTADELRRALEAAVDYMELSDRDTVEMALPRGGQTLLLHVECREPGVTGAYRQYEIGPRIGGGGFADVFRAKEKLTGRTVALKVLKRERVEDEKAIVRFRREARLLSRLSHPNIVRHHNFGPYGASFFIAMELLGERTLEDVIAEEAPMDPGRAVSLMQQILSGLTAVHEAGAVHRDLKPANVSIMDDRAVLLDFGLAQVENLRKLTMTGNLLGTPSYVSPEQATGAPIGSASDVYSAGVVLYEMLSRKVPHEDESWMGLARKIANDPPEPIADLRPDLAEGLAKATDRMLLKDPDRRPSAAEARELLLEALSRERAEPVS